MFPGSRLVYFDLLSSPRYEDYKFEYQSSNVFGFMGNGFHKMEYDGSDLSYYLGTDENPGKLLPQANEAVVAGDAREVLEKTPLKANGATPSGAALVTVVGV